jgi:hypothetical protein
MKYGRIETIPSTSKSTAYTVTESDYGNIIYTTANITLPASPLTNAVVCIKNTSNSDITINGNGNNIEEEATNFLPPKSSIHIHYDGTEWWVI